MSDESYNSTTKRQLIARLSALTVQLYFLRTRWLFMKFNVFESSLKTYGLSTYIAFIPLVWCLLFTLELKFALDEKFAFQ